MKGQKLKKNIEGNSTIWIPLVHNADTNISLLFSSVSSYKCVQITQTFLQHPLKLGKTLVSLVDKPHKELLDCFCKLYPVHHMSTTNLEFWIPYARHYNPRFIHFLPHFYKRLILQTILVHKQGKLGLKSAVYNQERFQMKSGLWWRAYGTYFSVTVSPCCTLSLCPGKT